MGKINIDFLDFDVLSEMNGTFTKEEIISIETVTVVTDSGTFYNRKSGLDESYQDTETTYRVWYKVEE